MKTKIQTVAVIGFATLGAMASTLCAGDTPSPRNAPDYCMLSDVVGAKVRMLPGAKAVVEATKDDKKVDLPTGKVKDLLVDTCNGTVSWAVVKFDQTLGFGGKTVVVPSDLMTWNKQEETFDLAQSEDQLKALPEFDIDKGRKEGMDATLLTMNSYWPSVVFGHRHDLPGDETAGREHKKTDTTGTADVMTKCPTFLIGKRECACAKPQLVLATDISSVELHTVDSDFGKVNTNFIDRANRKLALVAVKHDGSEYLVPLDAVCIHENAEGRAYCVKLTSKQITDGVKYEKPDEGAVNAEAARRVREYFSDLAVLDIKH